MGTVSPTGRALAGDSRQHPSHSRRSEAESAGLKDDRHHLGGREHGELWPEILTTPRPPPAHSDRPWPRQAGFSLAAVVPMHPTKWPAFTHPLHPGTERSSQGRKSIDIDVNIFIGAKDASVALGALPRGISHDVTNRSRLERDGQDRLWWGRIAVDLFLSNTEYHKLVERQVELHPFGDLDVGFLGCQSLATFKAFFSRDKDWVDLASMVAAGRVDGDGLRNDLIAFLGIDDPRVQRLDDILMS